MTNAAFAGMTKPQIVRELCREIRGMAGYAEGLAEIRRVLDECSPVPDGESPLRFQQPALVSAFASIQTREFDLPGEPIPFERGPEGEIILPEKPKKKQGRPRQNPDDPKWRDR